MPLCIVLLQMQNIVLGKVNILHFRSEEWVMGGESRLREVNLATNKPFGFTINLARATARRVVGRGLEIARLMETANGRIPGTARVLHSPLCGFPTFSFHSAWCCRRLQDRLERLMIHTITMLFITIQPTVIPRRIQPRLLVQNSWNKSES